MTSSGKPWRSHDMAVPSPWSAAARVGGLLLLALADVAARAQAAPAASAPAGPATGLHFVFDASESMCGYLRGDDGKGAPDAPQLLLRLMRFATTAVDEERNQRVVLIRQREPNKPSVRDLVKPPPEFAALAAGGPGKAAATCAPFDGADSQPVLAFETPGFAPRARSMVLVSDMQFKEPALKQFVDRFRDVARAAPAGEPVSAGIATLGAPFAGPYFPIVDPGGEFQRKGYPLKRHVRPLHVLWFLVGKSDIDTGRRLFEELGVAKAGAPALLHGLRLMPVPSVDPAQWFTLVEAPRLVQQLFDPPVHEVVARDGARSMNILKLCVHPEWTREDSLVAKVDPACRDGKPLFDGGVKEVRLTLPIARRHGLGVEATDPNVAVRNGAVELRFDNRRPPEWSVPLTVTAPVLKVDTGKLDPLNLESDECSTGRPAAGGTWQDACAARLEGRTYRYRALVELLALRAQTVLNERAAANRAVLKVQFPR